MNSLTTTCAMLMLQTDSQVTGMLTKYKYTAIVAAMATVWILLLGYGFKQRMHQPTPKSTTLLGHSPDDVLKANKEVTFLASRVAFNHSTGVLDGVALFKKMTKLPPYFDKSVTDSACFKPNENTRRKLRSLLVWWMHFAAVNDINWFLTYGSLIGSYRHKDLIPWDSDADVGIFRQDESKLRRLQTPRSRVQLDNVSFFVSHRLKIVAVFTFDRLMPSIYLFICKHYFRQEPSKMVSPRVVYQLKQN